MFREFKIAWRSLARAKGLFVTVVLTLALGIGANAAIFSVVHGVLLRPLANREEGRLVYIRQSADGLNNADTTFSVPEIRDLRQRIRSLSAIADYSPFDFTMIGLGEPRQVQDGLVDGNYFEVMELHPVLGRLLGSADDVPSAEGAIVLTNRFWKTALNSDPSVLGKAVTLTNIAGSRSATIVGVLEPSDPYPNRADIISNLVTSPHHLSATMNTDREHRMTELFGRLAPGTTVEGAQAELKALHTAMMKEHPEAYSSKGGFDIHTTLLRDEITTQARTVLLVLLAAAGLVFVIALSNVVNLILARTVKRESELAIRAALGAATSDLRRTLFAESLLLCGTGAMLGVLLADPMFSVLARYASRFSVRALDLKLDTSSVGVGAMLAVAAAFLLGLVPRLPHCDASHGFGLTSSALRITGATRRRLRGFAVVQIAASFILLAGAAMLLKTLLGLQMAPSGFQTARVVAFDVPVRSYGRPQEQLHAFYHELRDRVAALPGVEAAAIGNIVPWRDATNGSGRAFSVEGHVNPNPQDDPRAKVRDVSGGYFTALGIPILAGRDFNDGDRSDSELVVIINSRIAAQFFPGQDPLNRHLIWTDAMTRIAGISKEPRRIVGVVPDIDDEHLNPAPPLTVYQPYTQTMDPEIRLFVRVHSDPYAFVPAIRRTVHALAPDQPLENAATLEDVKAEVLSPQRLNTIVFGGFAVVALLLSIVGVAGVLAFSVNSRIREFGVRLAMGSEPSRLLIGVLGEGVIITIVGVIAGGLGGYAFSQLIGDYFFAVQLPDLLPIASAAAILVGAAGGASLLPALRASRVDVMEALRSE